MNLFERIVSGKDKIAVVGLGYVGLPITLAFDKKVSVIGFDIDQDKIELYKAGINPASELEDISIKESTIFFTSEESNLTKARFFVVSVPTPLNGDKMPDLKYMENASKIIGRNVTKGSIVVYESTVYPGVTEEFCIPILEEVSGMRCGIDFKVGYSPERINPGDKVHRLENIVKIVSGMDDDTLNIIAKVYELVIEAEVYRAENIKVAEAAKVIENAQRDINIAFVNELSMLFQAMEIDTQAVLKAAGTKWNFLNFKPGLVGGHCIGIDPYYLTYKAEGSGYHSKIILAGRKVNDAMGKYIAQQTIKILIRQKKDMKHAKVGIIGLAYKEDCSDIRNTKVIDILNEFQDYGINTFVTDPVINRQQVKSEYHINIIPFSEFHDLDALIIAVPHSQFSEMNTTDFDPLFKNGEERIMIDVKGFYDRAEYESRGYYYWSL